MVRPRPTIAGFVLAGGEGSRLWPLTAEECKPALPVGGSFRMIDFTLSNFVNSGVHEVFVLTQFKAQSLLQHLNSAWQLGFGSNVTSLQAQQMTGQDWYQGTADALYQCLFASIKSRPDISIISYGSTVARVDFDQVVDVHLASGAPLTAIASVIEDRDSPAAHDVLTDPHTGDWYRSLHGWVADTDALVEALVRDSRQTESEHDFAQDVTRQFIDQTMPYNVKDNVNPWHDDEPTYFVEVETIEDYYNMHLDLVGAKPRFPMVRERWEVYGSPPPMTPTSFVQGARIHESLVSPGCTISGGRVEHSVLSPGLRIEDGATLDSCVVMRDGRIMERAVVRRAILAPRAHIGPNVTVGIDPVADEARGLVVTDSGITIVPENFVLEA